MPSSGGQTCRSEEHTSELQSHDNLVCRLLLEKKHDETRARGRPPPHLSHPGGPPRRPPPRARRGVPPPRRGGAPHVPVSPFFFFLRARPPQVSLPLPPPPLPAA